MPNRETLKEFQTLSKCVGPLMVPQQDDHGNEPDEQKTARELLALSTLARMQVLMGQLAPMPTGDQPQVTLGTKMVSKPGECDNSAIPYPEAPLQVKGAKKVSPEHVREGEAQLIQTKLLRFFAECVGHTTPEHLPGLVVDGHISAPDGDVLCLTARAVQKPQMPPPKDPPPLDDIPVYRFCVRIEPTQV